MDEKKEYIEREAALLAITGQATELHYPGWYKGNIESIPAADVAPVVHGEWIERKSAFGGWHYDCPFCDDGFYMKERAKSKPNYCSNCGAKMDGGKR